MQTINVKGHGEVTADRYTPGTPADHEHDWAVTDSQGYAMECACGAQLSLWPEPTQMEIDAHTVHAFKPPKPFPNGINPYLQEDQ